METTECDCELPDWLQLWACPTCDWQVSAIECECYDIIAAIDRFRAEHPHVPQLPPRPNGRPHLTECMLVLYPDAVRLNPEGYRCTCDDWYPDI